MSPTSVRPEDWEQLVHDNENRMYRAALAILGDPGEAEDAVQDAFVKYLEKRPALEGPRHQANWLLKVTVNRCKSALRSPWRRRVALPDTLPAAGPEERQELEELMALPPKDRLVLHLFYYEGLSAAEIAALTGLTQGSVRSRLCRAREKLRVLMTEKEEP